MSATFISPDGTILPIVIPLTPALLQELIGGYIQVVEFGDNQVAVHDESGKGKGLPRNQFATDIVGQYLPWYEKTGWDKKKSDYSFSDYFVGPVIILSGEDAEPFIADESDNWDA